MGIIGNNSLTGASESTRTSANKRLRNSRLPYTASVVERLDTFYIHARTPNAAETVTVWLGVCRNDNNLVLGFVPVVINSEVAQWWAVDAQDVIIPAGVSCSIIFGNPSSGSVVVSTTANTSSQSTSNTSIGETFNNASTEAVEICCYATTSADLSVLPPTHLLGVSDDTQYTSTANIYTSSYTFFEDFVAGRDGNITRLEARIPDWWTASAAKIILCDSSGNHLISGEVLSSAGTGWVGVNVASTAVTAGTTYRLACKFDSGYGKLYNNGANGISGKAGYATGGTYASPPNPVASAALDSFGDSSLRALGTVTPTGPSITLPIDTDNAVTQGQTNVTLNQTNCTGTVTAVTLGGVSCSIVSDNAV